MENEVSASAGNIAQNRPRDGADSPFVIRQGR
jgi:hypothetical protein